MSLITGKSGKISIWKVGIVLVVVAGITVWFCSGQRGLFKLMRLRQEVSGLRQEMVKTSSENAAIQDTIQALESSDPTAVEREARNQGMIRPGETVYRVEPQAAGQGKK
jgi:cell division protein FtsB